MPPSWASNFGSLKFPKHHLSCSFQVREIRITSMGAKKNMENLQTFPATRALTMCVYLKDSRRNFKATHLHSTQKSPMIHIKYSWITHLFASNKVVFLYCRDGSQQGSMYNQFMKRDNIKILQPIPIIASFVRWWQISLPSLSLSSAMYSCAIFAECEKILHKLACKCCAERN